MKVPVNGGEEQRRGKKTYRSKGLREEDRGFAASIHVGDFQKEGTLAGVKNRKIEEEGDWSTQRPIKRRKVCPRGRGRKEANKRQRSSWPGVNIM